MHTGHVFELGSSPYRDAQRQNAFVLLLICTCVSMPITASKSDADVGVG